MSPDALTRGDVIVQLGGRAGDRDAAIRQVGDMLAAAGCVAPGYAASMAAREALSSTCLGSGVAIPHGLAQDRALVLRAGIAVLQAPDGVIWDDGQLVRLVVGIAASSETHLTILRNLSRLMQDEPRLHALFTALDPEEVRGALTADTATVSATVSCDLAERRAWTIDYPSGLHARPAAAWSEAARAAGIPIQVRHGAETADARDLLALLRLGLGYGDLVVLSAQGSGAAQALTTFEALIVGLAEKEKAGAVPPSAPPRMVGRAWIPSDGPLVTGMPGGSGLAVGRIRRHGSDSPDVPDTPTTLVEGARLLTDALTVTQRELADFADDIARRIGSHEAGIFRAQAALIDDVELIAAACRLMTAGHGAAWAWAEAVERSAQQLASQANRLIAARAADLRDVGRRVLRNLQREPAGTVDLRSAEGPYILVAADLSPSDTATLNLNDVAGLATASGGPTSHTAILARTLGLPAIVAAGPALLQATEGAWAILDGDAGRLYLEPSDEDLSTARASIAAEDEARFRGEARLTCAVRFNCGHTLSIGANVDRPEQIAAALAQGAEGVGLMRTESMFLERGATPSEDEQYEIYRRMVEALGGRPLVVRALDIGGDKQASHLGLPRETNPFLGVRGARLLLRRPDLLEPQLRALYRAASAGGDLSIMFPMITSVAEAMALKDHCERVRLSLDAPVVPLGIMIEIPAAALLAEALAGAVDFLSIGTNDLTQYTLAMDRQNADLAAQADSLHPAVLRLVAMTVEGAARHGRKVGVCGGAASEPLAARLFAGLGVSSLSMAPRDIPAVRAGLEDCDLAGLQALARRAWAATSAEQVRALEGTGG